MIQALAYLPDVRAAQANQAAVERTIAQARGGWLPSVDATLGAGRQTSTNASTRAAGVEPTLTRREADVSLTQLLFDGGAVSGQVRRFEARAAAASYQVASVSENAASRTGQTYVEVARLRAVIALSVENERRHEETLMQMTRLAEVGQGRRADAQQADARYALAQASISQQRLQLAQAEASYLNLTGAPPGELTVPDDLAAQLPATLGVAIAKAMQSQPAVQAAEQELLAAQADRDSARSRLESPRVALEAGTSSNHDLDGIRGSNGNRTVMVRLRYNLFRGGIDDARVGEAQARVDEAIANVGRARNDVERELRVVWEGLAQERVRLPQLARYATASAQVVEAYRAQFRIAQRSLIDVLNAENEATSARSSELNSRHAVAAGELRVLAAMGALLPAIAPPDDLMSTSAGSQ